MSSISKSKKTETSYDEDVKIKDEDAKDNLSKRDGTKPDSKTDNEVKGAALAQQSNQPFGKSLTKTPIIQLDDNMVTMVLQSMTSTLGGNVMSVLTPEAQKQFLRNYLEALDKPGTSENKAPNIGNVVVEKVELGNENGNTKDISTINTHTTTGQPKFLGQITTQADVPLNIETNPREMIIQPLENQKFAFVEGLFAENHGYENEIEVDRLQGMRGVTAAASIIASQVMKAFTFDPEKYNNQNDTILFYKDSIEVYNYGVQNVRHIFNSDFLKERSLRSANGKIFLPNELAHHADTLNIYNQLAYIAGNLQFIAVIGCFQDFLKTGDNILSVDPSSFNAPYNMQIKKSVMNLSTPSLYKAVYRSYDESPWINQMVGDQMSTMTYVLGKVSERVKQNIVISSVYAIDGIDQYTAGLLNRNASEYLANSGNMEHLCKRLKTYLLPESMINWDCSTDEIQCYIVPDVNERLQFFISTFCLAPNVYSMIYDYHVRAMTIYLTPIPTNRVTLFSSEKAPSIAEKAIQDVFDGRRSNVSGVQSFEHLMLMQIIPPIAHLRVNSSSLIVSGDSEEIFATLTVLSLFSLYFPLTFMMTIGYVQNWLVDVLPFFLKGKEEAIKIFADGRIAYRLGPDGNIEYMKSAKKWRQEYYDDGWLPLMHGLVYFKNEFPLKPGDLVKRICTLFESIGVWIDDAPDVRECHPRIYDQYQHYLPFAIEYNEDMSSLKRASSYRMNELTLLAKDRVNGPATANAGSTGSANMTRVLSNILGTITNDFNFCMHAHVAHWLRVVANSGMAVLKNFPTSMYEIPYSQYALIGDTVTAPLTQSARSLNASLKDQIDYNVVLSHVANFRTPVLKTVDPQKMATLAGPMDNTRFQYKNFIEAYKPLFLNDENTYKAMELLVYLRGLMDLMNLDRYSLVGNDATVYDIQTGLEVGKLRNVDETQYNYYYKKHLLMYGYASPTNPIITLGPNVTPQMFYDYLNDVNLPRIFLLGENLSQELKTAMCTIDIDYFIISSPQHTKEIFGEMTEFSQQVNYNMTDLILNIYPDFDLKKLLDPNGYTKNLLSNSWRQMLNTLAKGMNLDASVFGFIQNFDSAISNKMDLGAKIIRREVGGSVIPFDPNVDPLALRNYLFGMNERYLARLKIGANIINNEMMPQIQEGIIVVNSRPEKFIFYDTYDTDGKRIINYSPNLLTFTTSVDNVKIPCLFLDDEKLGWFELTEMIVINITSKQLYQMRAEFRVFLKEGVEAAKCALLIEDFKYTYEVVNVMNNGVTDWKTLIPDEYSFGVVSHIKFYDTIAKPVASSSLGINTNVFVKYVYPLQDLRSAYPIIGLEVAPEKRQYSNINLGHLYDTGYWNPNDTIATVNRFTDQNDPLVPGEDKVKSTTRLSMSNYVTVLKSSTLSDQPFRYTITDPQYDISQ